MRKRLSSVLLAATVAAVTAAPLLAQSTPAAKARREKYPLNVAITYDATYANVITGHHFWMQGGRVELDGDFYRGLGVVADVAGMHQGNIDSSGVSLSLVTATFGPRFTWRPAHKRTTLYGEALGGVAEGFDGLFPVNNQPTSSSYSSAMQLGGGVNIDLSPRVAVRVIEADWLRTNLPNLTTNAQNIMHMGAGIVFRFH